MDQHWIWSYSCVGQFKNACVFQWLSIFHKTYNVPHIWNYFETGHGKGENDGDGHDFGSMFHFGWHPRSIQGYF